MAALVAWAVRSKFASTTAFELAVDIGDGARAGSNADDEEETTRGRGQRGEQRGRDENGGQRFWCFHGFMVLEGGIC